MKKGLIVLLLALCARPVLAQTAPEGIWQGYDGEWKHVSRQLLDLAEATPPTNSPGVPPRACVRLAKSICISHSPISICSV